MTTNALRRRTRIRAAVAALGATLALSLTACQDGETGGGDGSAAQSPGAESPREPDGDDAAGEAGGAGETGETGDTEETGGAEGTGQTGGTGETGNGEEAAGSGTAGGGNSEDGAQDPGENADSCTVETTDLAASPVERPINHLLLTATNTGDATCYASYAPLLRLGDEAQAVVPRNEDSKPQAVVTLAPGETAYAALLTSSAALEGDGGYTATSLGLQFADADDRPLDGLAEVQLPGGEVYVDDTAQVSYWQSSLNDALGW